MTIALTMTQFTVLTAAAARPDGNIFPLPGTIRGGAVKKVVEGLTRRQLAERVDGVLRITDKGRATVGAPVADQPEIAADDDGIEVEQTGPYGEDEVPGTEDPPEAGMVFDAAAERWVRPDDEGATKDPETEATDGTDDTAAPQARPDDAPAPEPTTTGTDQATTVKVRRTMFPDPDAVPHCLVNLQFRAVALKGLRDALIGAGLEVVTAMDAAGWVDYTIAKALIEPKPSPGPGATPRATGPREGTKQQKVIEMLKRPEGATVAQICDATGWQAHTTRAMITATIGRKLGHTITTQRVTPQDGRAFTVYRIAQ